MKESYIGMVIMNDIEELNKEERRKFLRYLREGAEDYPDAVSRLSILANEYHDQAVQKAAITGLSKHKSSQSILGIAYRFLNSWGMGTIKHTIKISSRLIEQGGLILLSSTLFYDKRFIGFKLDFIKEALSKRDKKSIAQLSVLDNRSEIYRNPSCVNEWIKIVLKVPNLDVRQGAIFGSQYEGFWGWQAKLIEPCSSHDISRANIYIESRIPGLKKIYDETLNSKTDFIPSK